MKSYGKYSVLNACFICNNNREEIKDRHIECDSKRSVVCDKRQKNHYCEKCEEF